MKIRFIEIGFQRQRLFELAQRLFVSPILVQRQPARGVRLSEIWIECKRLGTQIENPL